MNYLKSDRIQLYRFTERYITADYMRWVNDQEINRYLTMGRIPLARDEITIPRPEENTLLFAVVIDDKYVGTASIHNIDWISKKAEVGYLIGEKSYWGKGYATELVGLLSDYAFNRLGLRKLSADVVQDNIASQKVLQKNGFTRWGINPQDFYLEGKYLDNYMYFRII